MNDRFLSFLGLAAKAGKVLYGATACEGGVKSGKVKLVVVDASASDNTKKQFRDACSFYKVDLIILEEENCLTSCMGKQGNKVIGIVCANFAKNAKLKFGANSGGEKLEQN